MICHKLDYLCTFVFIFLCSIGNLPSSRRRQGWHRPCRCCSKQSLPNLEEYRWVRESPSLEQVGRLDREEQGGVGSHRVPRQRKALCRISLWWRYSCYHAVQVGAYYCDVLRSGCDLNARWCYLLWIYVTKDTSLDGQTSYRAFPFLMTTTSWVIPATSPLVCVVRLSHGTSLWLCKRGNWHLLLLLGALLWWSQLSRLPSVH